MNNFIKKSFNIQQKTVMSYAPALIKTCLQISVTSGLNICKMMKKTELKFRSISF